MRPRKSSLSITLVLIGAAALGGCGREPDRALRRDVYASLEDCRADWGRVEDCELTSNAAGSSSGTRTGSYYGPRYYWSSGNFDDSRPRPGSRAQHVETLARSGVASSSSSSTSSRSGSSSSSHSTSSVSRGGFGSSASSHGASS